MDAGRSQRQGCTMSIKKVDEVFRGSPQRGSNRLVLLGLADYANDEGRAWPSVETLAKKVMLAPRNVQKRLRHLIECGEIRVEYNAGPSGVNVYILNGASPVATKPVAPQVTSPNVLPASPPHPPSENNRDCDTY